MGNDNEYIAQVPPAESILNDINPNDLARLMIQPRELSNNFNEWNELLEIISRKCPGLEFIMQQYSLAFAGLNVLIEEKNKEVGEDSYCVESVRLEKLISQLKIMFNMLVLIHNKEEAKRLEDQLGL